MPNSLPLGPILLIISIYREELFSRWRGAAILGKVVRFCVKIIPPTNWHYLHGNIPYMLDHCTNLVAHLHLLKSSSLDNQFLPFVEPHLTGVGELVPDAVDDLLTVRSLQNRTTPGTWHRCLASQQTTETRFGKIIKLSAEHSKVNIDIRLTLVPETC